MSTSIDGLSTGLDTTAIIDALLAVERLPQQRVLARKARSEQASETLGSLRTSVSNLRNTAADLRLSSGWERLTGTSSSETVQVNTTAGGFTGSLSFTVDALATTHVIYSRDTVESLETNVGSGGTLAQVVESINADTELNYVAVAVNTGDGYRLQLAAKEGGADSEIDVDTSTFRDLRRMNTLTEGADAEITFQGQDPYTVTSTDNTFEGLMPGVNVTVSEVSATPVTVSVQHDFEQIADSVGALVEQFNELKAAMAAATKVDPALETQVPLAFNPDVRRSEQGLLRAFVDPVSASAFDAPSLVGVSLQRDGTLSFDRDAFIDAAQTDIDGLTRLFTGPVDQADGILDRLVDAAEEASSFGTGLLSTAQDSLKARIDRYNDQIDKFESRFIRKETQLRKLYSALEVSIGSLNNQSNWLAGQLGSLSSSGGSS